MEKKNYFFFLFYFLINFKFSFSYFEQPLIVNKTKENNSANWENEETVKFSKSLDMGNCTCDLTSQCDHRCCCDKDCSEEIKQSWIEEKICLNILKNRMEGFKCKNKRENFIYNKNKSGIAVNDHINNIMCIYYDRSGDMGNFYVNEVNDDNLKEVRNNWINKFFNIKQENNRRLQEGNTNYEYGDILKFTLYKPNSNGECKKKKISYLIPFESSCRFTSEILNENTIPHIEPFNNKPTKPTIYGDNNYISEITYIIEYDNHTITNETINILKTNSKGSNKIKFKVLWKKKNINMNKKSPSGYFQGNPIKIAFEKDGQFISYQNGFFISMNKKDDILKCADNLADAKNPSPILFKNNIMYSCKYDNNNINYSIEKTFCNKELRIAKSPDKSVKEARNSQDWIQLHLDCPSKKTGDDININLLILTSKDGKENSPNEYIEYAKLGYSKKSGGNKIISFSVKFIELSYSSLMNSKDGTITSLIPLSEDILKNITTK